MFCEKCGQPINDTAVFCPSCGAKTAYSVPGASSPQQGYPPYAGYPVGYAQPPAAPAAVPYYPVPERPVRQRRAAVSKGGFVAMIILSAFALGLDLFYMIIYTFRSMPSEYSMIRLCEFLFCIIPFFVLCLLSKKLPGVVLAIPILILSMIVSFSAILWDRSGGGIWLLYDVALFAGAVMLLITMLIKSRPLAMRIITAILFGACAVYIAVQLILDISHGMFEFFSGIYSLGYLCGEIAMICLYTAVIVFTFAAKSSVVRDR